MLLVVICEFVLRPPAFLLIFPVAFGKSWENEYVTSSSSSLSSCFYW